MPVALANRPEEVKDATSHPPRPPYPVRGRPFDFACATLRVNGEAVRAEPVLSLSKGVAEGVDDLRFLFDGCPGPFAHHVRDTPGFTHIAHCQRLSELGGQHPHERGLLRVKPIGQLRQGVHCRPDFGGRLGYVAVAAGGNRFLEQFLDRVQAGPGLRTQDDFQFRQSGQQGV